MITINYSISLQLGKKRKVKNYQDLKLNLKWSQSKEIRNKIKVKERHPASRIEGFALVKENNKIGIIRKELIEQIITYLHYTASQKETFEISNILFGTNLSPKKHYLISRI